MSIQTAASSLIKYVDALTGKTGKGIAVNSKGSRFLLVFDEKRGGDYDSVGLDDRAGEAYYIRLKTGVVDETVVVGLKRGSCGDTSRISAKCRLVAMSHCDSVNDLATNMRTALASYKKRMITPDVYDANTLVQSIQYDFATVVNEEVEEDKREEMTGWEGRMSIIAIDFTLSYTLETCPPKGASC